MRIDVSLLPNELPAERLEGRAVVVIDVLRATSVMVRAIAEGALELLPVRTVEEAFALAKRFPRETTLLGGERGGRQIEGFDFGNSPREYTPARVRGKRLIMTTTNGTKAFHSVAAAREILVGSFFNVGALADRILASGLDLVIFPSGNYGQFSLEDTVCAGMLTDLIAKKEAKGLELRRHSSGVLSFLSRPVFGEHRA